MIVLLPFLWVRHATEKPSSPPLHCLCGDIRRLVDFGWFYHQNLKEQNRFLWMHGNSHRAHPAQ